MEPSQSQSGFFIGYGRLEDLLAHTDPSRPLYVELLTRRTQGNPLGWAEQYILVQDMDETSRVRYCRVCCGGYDLLHGGVFDREGACRAQDHARQRYERVLQFLASRNIRVERATIAIPKDLVLLNGGADFLHAEACLSDKG